MIKHKDNLAKLLATENVSVQYKNCQTAMFDVKNRVITLPIFKDDLSEPLLDLFIGHEVSHALHTPLEGLHETVSNKPVLKSYLNVIEDVRIEKMIKAKYPGLKVNMKKGYAELMDMDFFGVKQMGDDHVLSLIDKINLTTKVGEFLMLNFTDEERAFLDRSYLVETWDDVVALATEIYEWSQENENKEDDNSQYEEEQEEGDIPNETSGEGEEEGNSEEGPAEEGDTTEEYDIPAMSAGEDARDALTEIYAHKFEEHKLRDNTAEVLNIPSDYFDHWKPEHRIQSNELFIEQIKNYKEVNMPMINHIARKLETKNKKIISLMVKEYEIKKAGSLYARARSAKTGAVDTLKLAKYQIVEDMFKRATVLPEGKSHGIICYIDWSGSMDKVAYSALEQAYIVAKFCRQVGIPHRIFLFTSHNSSYDYDEGNSFYSEGGNGHLIEVYSNRQTIKKFQESSLVLSALIAYSCRSDFWNQNKAMRNDFMNDFAPLVEYYENGDHRYGVHGGWMLIDEYFPYPTKLLRMGGTPLNGLLHTARYLLREQKSQYNLDFQNLILVTDGFSNKMDIPKFESGSYYGRGSQRTMYTDPITKRIHDLRLAGDGLTGTMGMINYVKDETGASVTGYFIVRNKRDFSEFYWHIGWTFEKSRVFENANPAEDKWSECNKQGGVNLTGTSFDKLLFVKSITATGDDTLDDELVGAAKGKLKVAFSKNASSKIKSRFIVNQMIEGIQL